jgi:hypothetical protein
MQMRIILNNTQDKKGWYSMKQIIKVVTKSVRNTWSKLALHDVAWRFISNYRVHGVAFAKEQLAKQVSKSDYNKIVSLLGI